MMPEIKIISNPYKRKISYQKFDESEKVWKNIDVYNDGNSELLCTEMTDSFFPFKAKKIVDIILKEYKRSDSLLGLVFEGTDDEYIELESVCSEKYYQERIKLRKSESHLKNAHDILPDVKNIFMKMKPIIAESVKDSEKIESERKKFDDVSKEIIPLCVVGNYSCGKSTFINALIGYEILPSGDESLTAKIHEIKPSVNHRESTISFLYNGTKSQIHFEDDGYNIFSFNSDSPLLKKIDDAMNKETEWNLVKRIGKTLEIINLYDKETHDEKLDDLIHITVPFNHNSVLGRNAERFIIFDTPGSNSATNDKHIQVLKKAMSNLSNGIPLYISEYNTLDSTDNEKLCNEISKIDELDSRFTMIIVNKADTANIDKENFYESDVLSQAIPRAVYSGGLYFVSSILALGSKNDGVFENKHYSRIYRNTSDDYNDSDSPYYTRLFDFNILPEQIKTKSIYESQRISNRVYANSGMYWIEKEIESFAKKYSSYNKCWQSWLFLSRMVDISFENIECKKKQLEESKEQRQHQLDKEKSELVDKIDSEAETLISAYSKQYHIDMYDVINKSSIYISAEELQKLENHIIKEVKVETNYNYQEIERNATFRSIGDKLKGNSVSESVGVLKEIGSLVKDTIGKTGELKGAYDEVEKISSDRVIEHITDLFRKTNNEAMANITEKSVMYWTECSKDIRQKIFDIVRNSDAISDEKRTELTDIILKYEEPDLKVCEDVVFEKSDFKNFLLRLGSIRIIGDYKVNKTKLVKFYNTELEKSIDIIFESVRQAHLLGFNKWIQALLNSVESNITELNPELRKLFALINSDKNEIMYLESRKDMLSQYAKEIEELMNWKTDTEI